MKTIEKPMEYDHLICGDDHIEICAFQPNEQNSQRLIMWRLAKDSMPDPKEEIKGIWPFRKKIVYKYQNPWRKIEIVDTNGDDAYLCIGVVNADQVTDNTDQTSLMRSFIEWRNRLKTVEDVDNWAYTISEQNKKIWCQNHNVSEFIKVDDYVDEFGKDEVWK